MCYTILKLSLQPNRITLCTVTHTAQVDQEAAATDTQYVELIDG